MQQLMKPNDDVDNSKRMLYVRLVLKKIRREGFLLSERLTSILAYTMC